MLLVVLFLVTPCRGETDRKKPEKAQLPVEVDAGTQEVIEKINSVGAYEVPDLRLRRDKNYAHTSQDVEPFRHVKPYKEHFLQQLEYTGPGRAKPEPKHVETVKLGFIGPIMSTVSVATGGKSHEEALGIKMLQGARLAVEQTNARGGYLKRNIPFELVISNDNGLWGASGNEIVNMAYKDKVWAILGTIDGANSHIAIRVALKAEILMMNSGDTDPTFIETNIPWVVRCIGDDRQQAYLLVDYMYRKLGLKRVGVIRASNRYGRFGVREVLDGSRRLRHPVPVEMAYEVGGSDFSLQLERLREANVEAVVHWGDAADGARILNQMRKLGMKQPYFACDRCVSDEFLKIAGDNAEGIICGYPWNPHRKDEKLEAFRAAFRQRFGEEPETYAAHAYDGMNMLIWAVQVAGLNRAKIRDVLAYRAKPWPGVTGDIPLSAVMDDAGEVFLARRENGAWKYYSRKDLDQPKAFFDARKHRTEYAGLGREAPAPEKFDEVLIGYFGPSDPDDPVGGDMWRAAQTAVQKANDQGGYHGKPFRLVPGWSQDPWGTGVVQVTRMAYQDKVWAIIGGIDGPTTHLAEQVVAKARLTLVSPVSTDKTVNLANVPWMFSLAPGDHLAAPVLAAEIVGRGARNEELGASDKGKGAREQGTGRGQPALKSVEDRTSDLVLVSANDHDSRLFTAELRKALARYHVVPRYQFEYRRGTREMSELVERVLQRGPAAVVLVAGADDSAQHVTALRAGGFAGDIFGSPAMGQRRFLEKAGAAAEGVVFPLLYAPNSERPRFRDYAAAHTYDAVRLLIAAINEAGLNRARIRDALSDLSPWTGVTGIVKWDGLGSNTRRVQLGTIKDGRRIPVRGSS